MGRRFPAALSNHQENPSPMRMAFIGAAVCALAAAGCGGETTAAKNNVLDVAPDERSKIEEILKQHGITKVVRAMRDLGDHWHVSVGDAVSTDAKGADGKPKLGSEAVPDEYLVYKDGRVFNAFDKKPISKK